MTSTNSDKPPVSQHQSAGDVSVSGEDNAFAQVNAAGNAAIDQSRHVVYYYQEEVKTLPAEAAEVNDDCLKSGFTQNLSKTKAPLPRCSAC